MSPGSIPIISNTFGSYLNTKSQFAIPLDGTPLKYTGISTVVPTDPVTLPISTTTPSDGTFGCVVGTELPRFTPPATKLCLFLLNRCPQMHLLQAK